MVIVYQLLKSVGEDKLFDAPEGWVGRDIEQPTFKMYVSQISDNFVMNQYGKYARSVRMEALQRERAKQFRMCFLKAAGCFCITLSTRNSSCLRIQLTSFWRNF